MRTLIIAAALLLPGAAGAAPFCVVDNYGNEDCGFYSMDSCRDSARFRGGACVYRPENNSSRNRQGDSNSWDLGGSIYRGIERGREQRRARELHDLEVARRQAEIAAIQAQTTPRYAPPASYAAMTPVPYSDDKSTLFYQCDALARYAYEMKKGGHADAFRSARSEFEACRDVYEQRNPGDRALR